MTNLILGDSYLILKTTAADSIDAVVTDPPYGLSFMNKHWDYDVPSVELWREVFRVLKPGGHVLSFGGTRTYHRMVVNIEDAGFEIRDQLAWLYGQGFPKSQNVVKMGQEKGLFCGCLPEAESQLSSVRNSGLSQAISTSETGQDSLQSCMSKQDLSSAVLRAKPKKGATNGTKRSLEGRRDIQADQGELHRPEICSMPGSVSSNGSNGRLYHGTPSCDGDSLGTNADANGSRASQRPRHEKQSDSESRTLCEQRASQTCGSCGKAIIDPGLGTALKPALEPIVLARKPLVGTVASNVEQYGTGGLNIDASRIEYQSDADKYSATPQGKCTSQGLVGDNGKPRNDFERPELKGRWPANVLFDEEAAAVLDEQSGTLKSGQPGKRTKEWTGYATGLGTLEQESGYGDSGGASRFFYVAKASKRERGEGNNHPTVKPIKLMEYLITLITPPGGQVLDPFMGSGTTGVAARNLGFGFVGIEQSKEYFEIANRRI